MTISSIIQKLQKIQEDIGDEEVCISLHELGEEETEPLFIDGVDLSITM
jgi:hypothetical protein